MNEEDLELIDRVLQGQATAVDEHDFELKMKNNPDFKEYFNELKQITDSIRLNEREKLIDMLRDSDKERTLSSFFPLAIAASVLLLIVAGYFVSMRNDAPFDRYYERNEFITLNKPRGPSEDYIRKTQAYAAYKIGENGDARRLLADVEELDDETYLLSGLVFLDDRNYNEALAEFIKIEAESRFYEDARWFIALSYLQLGNLPETRNLLRLISSSNSRFKSDAQSLLSDLSED